MLTPLTPEEEQAAIELAQRISEKRCYVQIGPEGEFYLPFYNAERLARALLSLKGKLEEAEKKLKSYGEYIEHASRVMDNGGYIND